MAGFIVDDLNQVRMFRFYLETQFPTLSFQFLKNMMIHPDLVAVRITHRADKRFHEELVDPKTFPADDFLVRCALIA